MTVLIKTNLILDIALFTAPLAIAIIAHSLFHQDWEWITGLIRDSVQGYHIPQTLAVQPVRVAKNK
jgi:hypothetical protein